MKNSPQDLANFALQSCPDGVLTYDLEGKYTFWNPGMEKLTGMPAEKVLGRKPSDVFPLLKEVGKDKFVYLTVKGETATSIQEPFHVPESGRSGFFEAVHSPLRDSKGEIIGGMAVVRDVTERATQAANDQLFRTIAECIPQIVWVNDGDFSVIYYNKRWYEYTGQKEPTPSERAEGLKWADVVHPDDLPQLIETSERLRQSSGIFEAEYRLRHHSGEYRWFLGRSEPVQMANGQILRRIGTAIDIHEKKIAEQKKNAINEQFRTLVEQTPFAFQLYTLDGTCVYANEAWEKFWGSNRKDLIGSSIHQWKDFPLVETAFTKGETLTLPDLYFDPATIGKEGRPRWCRAHFFPVIGANGEINHVATFTEDVTIDILSRGRDSILNEASKLLTQSLEVSAILPSIAKLCATQIADYCVIDLLNPSGNFQRVEVTGGPAIHEKILEKMRASPPSFQEPTHPVILAHQQRKTVFIQRKDHQIWTEKSEISEDGRKKILEIRVLTSVSVPLRARGNALGVMSVGCLEESLHPLTESEVGWIEEIADRLSLAIDNANLYHASKQGVIARDTFMSTASHELKTPLTSLQLQLQKVSRVLLNHISDPKAGTLAQTFSVQADRQIHRLTRLVDDMLDISRIASGKLRVEPESLELTELTREVCERLQPLASDFENRIEFIPGPPVFGEWDGVRIEQVLNNLLTNSFRYGGKQPVEVRVWESEDSAFISVRDWGRGISKADQERIFERFERAYNPNGPSGFGLGLYIAREIVALHQGSIQVESELGKGSTFTVRLPLHPPL